MRRTLKGMVPLSKYRIDFDPVKCRWCRSCELVCSLHHNGVCSPSLSRIHIGLNTFEAEAAADICKQCRWPACMFACPVEGAMAIDETTGARIIVEEKCTGCGLCAKECPYNHENTIIRLNPLTRKYFKCDLCGGKPQCVDMCPLEALIYVETKEV